MTRWRAKWHTCEQNGTQACKMAYLSKQNNTPRPLDNPLTGRAVVGSFGSSKMLEQTVSERANLHLHSARQFSWFIQ